MNSLNRRNWITGMFGACVLAITGNSQEPKSDAELIYCKPLPMMDEEHRYSYFSDDTGKYHGVQARKRYQKMYSDQFDQFALKSRELGDMFNKTKQNKYLDEQQLWINAVMCAAACLDDVKRLRKRYDNLEVVL